MQNPPPHMVELANRYREDAEQLRREIASARAARLKVMSRKSGQPWIDDTAVMYGRMTLAADELERVAAEIDPKATSPTR